MFGQIWKLILKKINDIKKIAQMMKKQKKKKKPDEIMKYLLN